MSVSGEIGPNGRPLQLGGRLYRKNRTEKEKNMKYIKPVILNVVCAHESIMGMIKGVQAPDNDSSSSQLATASAYEADE